MRALTSIAVLLVPCAALASPEPEPALGAALFVGDLRLEPAPLGDLATDASVALEGILTRTRPVCPGLRIGFDPDSDGEGTSEVRSIEIPLLARVGLCTAGRRFFLHPWVGAGVSYVSVTTVVDGVERTDGAVASLFGVGVDLFARWQTVAGLVGLSGELSNERWAVALRLGLGTWG